MTSDTLLIWRHNGSLPAQRTAGGHRCLAGVAHRSRSIHYIELREVELSHDHLLPACAACDHYRPYQAPGEETR